MVSSSTTVAVKLAPLPLIPLSKARRIPSLKPEPLISNFGVALAATVVGVMVRSVLNQMRRDVATVERDVQQQLSVASGKLTGQISVTIENFAIVPNSADCMTHP